MKRAKTKATAVKLMRHTIPTNAGLAKFIGTGLKSVDKVINGKHRI
ncbi:hypothetical protein O9929_18625 [Vibrio lentus]|nr:hypothetical protein [Vibrio lentus]